MICKCTDIDVAFTQEYSKVLYLSSGKQWLRDLITKVSVNNMIGVMVIDTHIGENQIKG